MLKKLTVLFFFVLAACALSLGAAQALYFEGGSYDGYSSADSSPHWILVF